MTDVCRGVCFTLRQCTADLDFFPDELGGPELFVVESFEQHHSYLPYCCRLSTVCAGTKPLWRDMSTGTLRIQT